MNGFDEDNEEVDIMEEKKQKIIGFINDKQYQPMKVSEIMYILAVPSSDSQLFTDCISELEEKGKLVITKKGKVVPPEKLGMINGTFLSTSRGFGFVKPDDGGEQIFIPRSAVGKALHKDKVLCKIGTDSYGRTEGEIVKITEKGINVIVGTFVEIKRHTYVVPDNNKIDEIFISKSNTKGAVNGHKVVVKIIKNNPNSGLEGKVTEILGHINDPGVDILSIIKEFELPLDFDDEVYDYVEKIPSQVNKDDISPARHDDRNVMMVTIDGEDAKDLDDAVTVSELENGSFKLGVYIADVSHYVKEGSVLDKEALKRGTSVYLVDRVIPMLPHKLSNGICSLNANEDRLSLACTMEIDKNGNVVSHEIFEALINIDRRMSYTVVNDLLTNEDSEYREEYEEFIPMFKSMEKLRNILLKKRIKRGSIEFDFTEAKIILDEDGKPIDIIPHQRNIATSIIEEFMLAANETVAEEFYWLELPFVYRCHEEPDEEKMQKLSMFINKLGYSIKGGRIHPKSIQKLIQKSKDTPEDIIINKVVLRSLKRANYMAENLGHFGLAAKYYCHFTSPIRRYPDLQIHRIIKEHINGKLSQKETERLRKKIPDTAKHCSLRERVADDAERATDDLKKAQFMEERIGCVYDGIISSITSWGIYVELENTVEGMISVKDIYDDRYIYDEDSLSLIGERTHKAYTIGDKVKIEVESVNVTERNINFVFAEESNEE